MTKSLRSFFVNKVDGPSGEFRDILHGLRGEMNILPSTSANFGSLRGSFGEVSHQGTGNIINSQAAMGATILRGSGTIQNARGGRFFTSTDAVSSGTITNATGVWAQVLSDDTAGATITNANLFQGNTGGPGTVENLTGLSLTGLNKGTLRNTGINIGAVSGNSANGNFGLTIGDVTGSSGQNVAIQTGAGVVNFGGNVTINRGNDNPRLFLRSNNATTYSNRVLDVFNGNFRLYREGGPEGTKEFFNS